MADHPDEKAFKPLKLTSLKPAKPVAPPEGGAAGGAPDAPVAPAAASAPVAAVSTSALKPFKLPLSSRPSDSAAADSAPASGSGAQPALSPLNISAHAAEPSVEAPAPLKPLTMNFSAATLASPLADSVSPESGSPTHDRAPVAEPAPVAVSLPPPLPGLKPAVKPVPAPKSAPAPASPAKGLPGKRKRVPVVFSVLALIAAAGAYCFTVMTGEDPAPVKPVRTPAHVATPAIAPEPVVVEPEPVKPVVPAEVVVAVPDPVMPRSRKSEIDAWLKSAVLSTVSPQRIALNDKAYSLNEAVNPEGTLRWIGRDSVTRDLLFVDGDGVVYTKPSIAPSR